MDRRVKGVRSNSPVHFPYQCQSKNQSKTKTTKYYPKTCAKSVQLQTAVQFQYSIRKTVITTCFNSKI